MEQWIQYQRLAATWNPGTCMSHVFNSGDKTPHGLVARITKGGEELTQEDVQGALRDILKANSYEASPEAVDWEI